MALISKTTKVAANNKRNASIVKLLGACILLCVVFCAGFVVRGSDQLLQLVGLSQFSADAQVNPGQTVTGNTYDSISARVAEVEGVLDEGSLDSYDLDKATSDVLAAYLGAIDDSFIHYYDEQGYQSYLAASANTESGIGVLFAEKDGTCYAADVFEDSEAAAAGVQAGDILASVDGVANDAWTLPDVIQALSREEGSSVYLTWQRPAASKDEEATTFGTTLDFSSEATDNITYSVDDGVGVINVTQITTDSASVLSNAITECQNQGANAFVLDLRDVPGGYLTQAVECASLFIKSGSVVQIQTAEGVSTKSADAESVTSAPLVVVVNERTSGAAEVLAAALQETYSARVVGMVTQGKGSVQVMQPLSFGGALRYTAAYYLTPNGRSIDGNGISPDIEISNAAEQQQVAIEAARSQIR